MTRECRDIHYNKITQNYEQIIAKYNKQVSTGKSCNCLEAKIIGMDWARTILSCYTPYEEELTYLYKLIIVRSGSDAVTITLSIGSDDFVYTGSAGLADILQSLADSINASSSPSILAYISQGALYIYSYDTSIDFYTTTTISSSSDDTSVTLTNLVDYPNTLVNIWNCMDEDTLCEMINKVYALDTTC